MTHLAFVLEYNAVWGDGVGILITDAQKVLFPADVVNGTTPISATITLASDSSTHDVIITSPLGFYPDDVNRWGLGYSDLYGQVDEVNYVWAISRPYIASGDLFECDVSGVFWRDLVNVEET